MRELRPQKRDRAFNLLEMFISVAVVAALVTIALRTSRSRATSCRINCSNNLKQVGLSFLTWALDNTNRFPMQVPAGDGGTMELIESGKVFCHFRVMSNELSTPKILYCPEERDAKRTQANSFATPPVAIGVIPFTNDNQVSYFIGVDADPKWPQMFLCGDRNLAIEGAAPRAGLHPVPTNAAVTWLQPRHNNGGNICLADGSVQGFGTSGLRAALVATGIATNRLAMP